MHRVLRTMLSDTPLIKNLDNPQYMDILLDGKSSLEELFSEMKILSLDSTDKSQPELVRVLPGFLKLAKNPKLPEQVGSLFNDLFLCPKSN